MTAAHLQFHTPTRIHAGVGVRRHLSDVVDELGVERVALVRSPRFGASNEGAELVGLLGDRLALTWDATGEPAIADVRRLVPHLREAGVDGLVAVGGGAVFGLVKCAAADLASDGGLEALQWAHDPETDAPVSAPLPIDILPIVALPTTAGSGSEVNGFGSVRDADRKHKVAVRGAALAPRVALLDGALTASANPRLTAGAGLNALSHCVEAIYSRQAQPISTGLALEAARLIGRSLPRCVQDGADLEARQDQLLGSALSSMAFANAMIGLHSAFCHALAVVSDVVYGDAQSVIFGRALAFRSDVIAPATAAVADAMGLHGPAEDAWRRLAEWADALGGPVRLRDIGVTEDQVPALAEAAFADRNVGFDPRPVTGPDELLAVLEAAW